jgi:hypothetical protein
MVEERFHRKLSRAVAASKTADVLRPAQVLRQTAALVYDWDESGEGDRTTRMHGLTGKEIRIVEESTG